jgi:hypothetical protein
MLPEELPVKERAAVWLFSLVVVIAFCVIHDLTK